MNNRIKTRGTLYFQKDISAGASGYIDARHFVSQGSISHLELRFYSGQENTLEIKPVLVDAQGSYDEIIDTYGDKGKGVVSGENDLIPFDVDTPFDKGDFIRIYYDNKNGVGETYTLKVWLTFYYEGVIVNGRS